MNTDFLHPEIIKRTRTKLENRDYEGAIYDATTYLEARLQEIGGTKTINTSLVEEVFINGKIKISSNNDRNIGAKNLFDGTFRLIRNDRAHDKSIEEKTEITCDKEADCLMYLGFISLLITYLERNIVTRPTIDTHNISLNVELRGNNFTPDSKVYVNSSEVRVLSIEPRKIIISLPNEPSGLIQVKNGYLFSNAIEYFISPQSHENRFKVIATDIKLFTDKETTTKREGVHGVKLMVYEQGRQYPRISPTKENYTVGDYVAHRFDTGEICGETWYKDPLDSGIVKYAWTSSALFNSEIISKEKSFKPIQLSIKPETIVSGTGETRLLRAIVIESDGTLNLEKDISQLAEWKTEDTKIAYLTNRGFLRLKSLGETRILCTYKGLHDSINVKVITPTTGTKVKYFSSDLKRYQQIRFDAENNLYITNQSPSVYKITAEGLLEELLRLPQYEDPNYGFIDSQPSIDTLAIDPSGQVYINCSLPRSVYKVAAGKLNEVIKSSKPLKGIDVDSKGVVYVGNMDNEIIKIKPNGDPEILPIGIHSIDLKLLDDSKIIVGSAGGGNIINIYSTSDGTLLKSISSPFIKSPTDFAVKNGEAFVACFHSGVVYKLDLDGDNHIKIVEGLETLGGIDFDKEGNLYASVYDSRDPDKICIYKIYL